LQIKKNSREKPPAAKLKATITPMQEMRAIEYKKKMAL